MVLDEVVIELCGGEVVYVTGGVGHRSFGGTTVPSVCIPRGVPDDAHELE